jgi:hypothetical protein
MATRFLPRSQPGAVEMMFGNRRGVLASSLVLAVNTVCGVGLVLANLLYYGPSDEVAFAQTNLDSNFADGATALGLTFGGDAGGCSPESLFFTAGPE